MPADRLLISHTDLDGAGAAVVWHATTGSPFRLVENGSVEAALEEELVPRTSAAQGTEVVLADHSFRPEALAAVEAYVAAGGRFALLDHHVSARDLDVHEWARIDVERCGTTLLWDYLGRPPATAEFAACVEDHDLWRHADERSARLAALLGLLGHQRFIHRFSSDPSLDFSPAEKLLLELEEERRTDYIERRLPTARVVEVNGQPWAVCFAEAYQSDLAHALMERLDVAATMIVNPAKSTVSMRGRDVDVSVPAVALGGGGHARAAAFSARGTDLEAGLDRYLRDLVDAVALAAPRA